MNQTKLLTLLALTFTVIAMAVPAFADLAPGIALDFNANDPCSAPDSANWNSLTADNSQDWDFGDDVTLESVSSASTVISKAFKFTGVTGDDNPSWNGYGDQSDSTWEFWLKPSDTGNANQTIFETGANGTGMGIWYAVGTDGDKSGTINFTIDGGTPYDTVSAEIDTTDFRHIVCVYTKDIDVDGSDLMQIYVDGTLAADNSDDLPTGINDWSGTHGSGLGGIIGNAATGSQSGPYTGYISVFRFWETKALTPIEIVGNYDLLAAPSVNVLYPQYGEVVDQSPAAITLLWENLDPNATSGATDTYVDVWFGTDPEDPASYTKVVDGGMNVESYTTDGLAPGIYYWQVDSYLFGEPGDGLNGTVNYDLPGDPNVLPGRVYMFTNDAQIESVDILAPAISATPNIDIITWSGGTVDLAADPNDDGGSALTYSWTTGDLPPGVTAAFDPDAASDVTALTITRAPYEKPWVENGSFEIPEISDGTEVAAQNGGTVPPWLSAWKQTASADWNFHTWRGGAYNPTDAEYDPNTVDGENVGWVTASSNPDYEHCIYQETSVIIEAGKTYELSVMAGSRLTNALNNSHRIELVGSGIAANSGSQSAAAPGEWVTTTISFTPAADDPNVGEPLTIRLVSEGGFSTTGPDFDSVVLTVDGVAGEMFYDPAMVPVTVTLSVNDETNPPVTGTITLDVYDTACDAARDGLGRGADHPADFDGNCSTGLEDLATIAMAWLNDTSITEPVTK